MGITFFSLNGTGSGGGGGGTVITANGIGGTGVLADPIILGGDPLDQNTFIQIATFQYGAIGADGGGNEIEEVISAAIGKQIVAINAGGDQAGLNVIIAGGAVESQLGFTISGGSRKMVRSNSAEPGMSVTDELDNVGFVGSGLFPIADPKQYAQYGNIATPVASVNVPGETTTQTLDYTAGSSYEFLRITALVNVIGSVGTVSLGINWLDPAGNSQNYFYGSVDNVNQVLNPAIVHSILLGAGNTVTITWTVAAGTPVFDMAAIIEKLA